MWLMAVLIVVVLGGMVWKFLWDGNSRISTKPDPISYNHAAQRIGSHSQVRRYSNSIASTLRTAMLEKRKTTITYTNSEGITRQRVIDIYGMGNGFLDAFDSFRDHQRTFRISRIMDVEITGELFVKPLNYSPSSWVNGRRGK